MVQHKRQDELFHEAKDAQVRVAANLVQNQLLFAIEKRKLPDTRERFRHERLGEVEPLLAADNIFYAPMANFRCGEGRLIGISIKHFWNTSLRFLLNLTRKKIAAGVQSNLNIAGKGLR